MYYSSECEDCPAFNKCNPEDCDLVEKADKVWYGRKPKHRMYKLSEEMESQKTQKIKKIKANRKNKQGRE